MSKFTRRGSEALDRQIASDLKQIETAVSPDSVAGILIGSYARGEGTPFINPDGTQSPFNDYDLVIITDSVNPLIRARFRALEKQLTEQLGIPVDLCPYARKKLPRAEFSLLNYEMKYGHKVLWGNQFILNEMPDYKLAEMPPSEGTRLLLNRGKLLLDIQQRLKNPEPLSQEEHLHYLKFLIKTLLAFGDSILLSTGKYDISYAVKKERIKRTGTFPASGFIVDGYLKAVELKESGRLLEWNTFNIAEEFKTVREVYLRYTPWYRARCIDCNQRILKNLLLNLKWNRTLSATHPREKLYNALPALLQDDESIMAVDRFYEQWRRFS